MSTPDFKKDYEDWRQEMLAANPNMTNEELLEQLNKDEALLEKLQMRTGKTKKEIFNWLHLMG